VVERKVRTTGSTAIPIEMRETGAERRMEWRLGYGVRIKKGQMRTSNQPERCTIRKEKQGDRMDANNP
jgi:hypothetical protein